MRNLSPAPSANARLGRGLWAALLAAAGLAMGTGSAQAQNYNWNQTAGGSWATAADWTPNTVPNSSTADAIFGVTSGAQPITIDGAFTVNQLTFINNSTTNNYTITNGSGTGLTLGGTTPTIQAGSGSSNTINATLAGSAGLVVSGSGTITQAGAQAAGGTIVLGGTNTFTGTATVNMGATLLLDFSQAAAPLTNILNSNALSLGNSGTLTINGLSTGTNSQTFAGLTLTAGASAFNVTQNGATSVSAVLNAITRNTGSSINFTLPTAGTITTTTANANITGGQQTILGGYATVAGNTWAVSGSGGTAGAITGLATYNTGFLATKDIDATAPASVATMTVNSVRFNTAAPNTTTLSGALTVATGGILETSTVGNNAVTITGSTITSGNAADLIVNQYNVSNSLTIASQIIGAVGFTKAGSGTVVLNGATLNTYNGVTNINGGILSVTGTGGKSNLGTGNVNINTGGTLIGTVGDAFGYGGTGPNTFFINGGTLTDAAGTYRLTLQALNFTGGSLVANAGNPTGDGNGSFSLQTGSVTSNATTTTAVIAGGSVGTQVAITFTIAAGSVVGGTTPGIDMLVTSKIIPYGGNTLGIIKAGAGVLELTAANTYGNATNGTTINAGTLLLGITNALPTADPVVLANVAGANLTLGTGFSQTISGGLTGGGALGGNIVLGTTTASTLTLNAGANTIGGVVSGAGNLVLSGGSLVLSNANIYSGATTISGSTLTVSNTTGSATGTTNVAFSNGTLTSGTTGIISGTVTVSGATVANLAPGGIGTVGTLTLGGLTTTSNTYLNFDETTPWSGTPANTGDLLVVTGSNALNVAANTPIVLNLASNTAGNYRLIGYSGTAPTLSNFSLPGSPRTLTYALSTSVDAGYIDLVATSSGSNTPITANWLPTAAGTYSWVTPANWSTNPIIPGLSGDTANFNSAIGTNSQTILLNGQQHVGALTFNPTTTTGSYTLAQNLTTDALYLDNTFNTTAATLTNTTGSNAINAPVTLVSSVNASVASGTTLTLSGVVSGAGKLTLASGTGTLLLSGTVANTYTGGTEIDSGTLAISAVGGTGTQLNNAGVGTTTLNGGTLSFTAVTGQTTPVAGFVLNFGTNGGTLNASGAITNGKVLMQNAGQFTGSGTFTKTGGGDMQINAASPGFTGNVNVNGLIEFQNVYGLGYGNAVTVGSSGELVASGTTVLQSVALNAGTLSSNAATGIFANTVTVTGSSILAARLFQTTANSQNFAINTLAGSGNVSIIGGTAGTNGLGLVTLGSASTYTGTISVGAYGAIGIGNSASGNFFGTNTNAISVVATGGIGLVADGDGTGSLQTIAFTLPTNTITFAAGNTGGYLVGRQGATALSNTELNKTISLASLPLNATNTLVITPLNGYGLLLDPVLTATTTYTVNGTQASNVLPGLTLTGLTGGFGIIKNGTGTLQLGVNAADSTNTFGTTGTIIDIQGGLVQAASDQNLGNSLNNVKLDVNSAAQGFRAIGTFSTSRTFTLAQAANDIEVTGGNTLTINSGLAYGAVGNVLTKNDNGTLTLTQPATGAPTSGTTISAGALQISNSNQIGSGTITLANAVGAALQVGAPATTYTQALSLSSSGIQGRGALESMAGSNIFSGVVTITNAALIGNDASGTTLTLSNPSFVNTGGFATVGAGNVTISGVITGAGSITVVPGSGVLRLTNGTVGVGATTQVFGGPLTYSGTAAQGTGGYSIGLGGLITFDNSTTNINNRNGSHTLNFNVAGGGGGGGTLNVIGNASAATTETFLGFQTGRGEIVLQLSPNAAQSITETLTSSGGAYTRNPLTSVVYQAPGLGSAAGAGIGVINEGSVANTGFQGAVTAGASANQQVQPWALAYNTSNPTSAITFATANGATAQNYRPLAASEVTGNVVVINGYAGSTLGTASTTSGSPTVTVTGSTAGLFVGEAVSGAGIAANAYIASIPSGTTYTLAVAGAASNATATASGVLATYSTTGVNVSSTTASTGPGITLAPAINSLTLATGGSLTLNSFQTLTIGGASGGGILATDTTNGNTISGGIVTAGANELDVHTIANLTISSTITGGAGGGGVGLTKGESGTLTLTSNAFYTGQTVLNGGTLNLNAGNNTIQFSNYLAMGVGSTLQLNGNSQIVTDLFSDSVAVTGLGTVGGNSTVTGTAGSAIVVKNDAARFFTGTITGAVGYVHSATAAATSTFTQSSNYTGPTLINGGGLTLVSAGALTGTTSLTIVQAILTLDNNSGSQDVASRIPSALAISLGGGTISYIGRTQFASTETLGAITTTFGANTINVTQQATGVSTADLTLTSLTRTAGSTVNFTNTGGALGLIGSNPNILLSTAPTLVNNLIGGGYTVNGNDWASYNTSFGVGGLSTAGFAGYSPLFLNNAASTDNVTMATSLLTGAISSQTVNSLRITGTTTIAFNSGQTLTLTSGGLLINGSLTLGSAVGNGMLTSGGSELFLYANAGTNTINSVITDGVGPVSVTLVKSGVGAVTLTGVSTYTGGTLVDQGTLTIASGGAIGTGGLFHNGGTVVEAASGGIPSQAVSIAGNGTLTLAGANTFTTLTFANNGGTTAPNITTTGGVLTISTGAITASSSNVGATAVITAGTVDLANVTSPTITVNPIIATGFSNNFAPTQPTLSIAALIQNASNALSVTGGGNLQVSGASTFTGGVNLGTNTALTIAASSTNNANGIPISGPLGQGTLALSTGNTLYSTGAFAVNNAVTVAGNFAFDAPSTAAASLTLGGGINTISLPTGATTITVNAPNMTGTLGGIVNGADNTSNIIKAGAGILALSNNNNFAGGIALNNGTLLAQAPGALGTGAVTINGGLLALHINGNSSNSPIYMNNNVVINGSLSGAFIDINNNGANTGNTIVMGSLSYTGFTGGNPAPSTILNVTGGSSYSLRFQSTNLTGATSSPTFNIATGLSLILPGGFTVGTNLPTNIGLGTLIYSGSNSGVTASSPITGTTTVAPGVGQTSTPLGTGGITLNNNATLQITPLYSNSISSTGYTVGGMTQKTYFTGAATAAAVANYGIAPNSQYVGVTANDAALRNSALVVNNGLSASNTLFVYQGLLNVTKAGTYYFGGGSDDQLQISVDGNLVVNDVGGGHALNQDALGAVNLSSGLHNVTIREFNNAGGGGVYTLYSGPDTAANGLTGTSTQNNLQALPMTSLYYAAGAPNAANGFQNSAILGNAITVAGAASATIDGVGTDFNYAVPSLSLGAGSTIVVANGNGTTTFGNGIFTVTGSGTAGSGLAITGAGAVVNTTTGTINLAGGITDSGNGLTKIGQGTMVLGANATGTPSFTGTLNINQGYVQLSDPTGLTTGTTNVGTFSSQSATTNTSTAVTVTSTTGLFVGEYVIGTGIPANATIASITDATHIVISAAATTSVTQSVTFSSPTTLDLNGQGTLGTPIAGTIVLNGGNGPIAKSSNAGAGLYNSSATVAVLGGTLSIGTPINGVNPMISGFGDINITGVVQDGVAGQAWSKLGPNTLILSGANTFTGALTVSAGVLQLGSTGSLGTSATNGLTIASGATLDLNGQTIGVLKALSLNGAGMTGVGNPNSLGVLINSSTTAASYAGPITLVAAANSIGSNVLSGTPAGTLTLSGAITGAFQITKIGSNNLTFTGSGAETLIDVQDGTVTFSGAAGAQTSQSQANIIRPGATLLLDNSVTALSQRLGNRGIYLNGNLTINGNSGTAVSEVISQGANNMNLGTNGFGQATITLNASGTAGVTLQVASTSTSIFARSAGTSALIRGTNLGSAPAAGVATLIGSATSAGLSNANGQSAGQSGGFGTTNQLIYPWAVADTSATGVGIGFATYNGNTNGVSVLQASGSITAAPVVAVYNVNTTNASTTVTTTSTTGLVAGELVVGTGIAAGTTIASITNTTTFVLSANATATAFNTIAANAGTGTFANLVSTASTNAIGASRAAQELNSLTLNNAAGSTTTITGGLQLDSGGLLAVGTNSSATAYTIGGTGTLTTTGLSKEIIVHTTGTQTTLTISAPIFTTAGLTKADGGTLVLGTQEGYIGTTAVNQGTLQLAGGNNTLFSVYTTAPAPGASASTVSGQALNVNFGGTLDLNGTTQAISVLNTGNGTSLLGGTVTNSSATASVLHIAPSIANNTTQTFSGAFTGNLSLIRDGNGAQVQGGNNPGALYFNSPSTMTGSASFIGGATILQDLGTFQAATAVNVTRAALIWNDTGVQAVGNRLSSTAPVTLTGGGFQFQPRAGTGATPTDNISLGALTVIGTSEVSTNPAQGGSSAITFASIARTTGSTFNFNAGAGEAGANPFLYFTSAPTNTNGIIGGYFTTTGVVGQFAAIGATFATYDPVVGVRALSYGAAATYGAGVNTLLTANATLPTGNNTIASLTIFGGTTVSFVNATDTLTVQTGGILANIDKSNRAIGSAAIPGNLLAGSDQPELFIHNGSSSLTVNSKILDNGFSGGLNVVFDSLSQSSGGNANNPTVVLTNANTYLGTTYVSGLALNLNSSLGVAIPGNIVLNGGNNNATDSLVFNQTNLQLLQPNQIASTATLTMNGATQFYLGAGSNAAGQTVANTQTLASLTINNDGGSNSAQGPAIYTGAGTLTISGTTTVTAGAETFTVPFINGFLNLTTGNIAIAPNLYNAGQIGLAINANIVAPSLNVTGGGVLGIGGQSGNLTGAVNVNGTSTLAFSAGGALLGGQVVLASGATLDPRGLTGTIGSLSGSGTVTNGLQGTAGTVQVGLDGTTSTFSGTFTSPYPTGLLNVTKIGNGTLNLTGVSTATNSGVLMASAGTVAVNSGGQLGFSTYTINTGGTITLDNTATAQNDRLGGAALTTTMATLAPTLRTLNIQGGSLIVNGNSGTAVTENLGTIGAINGSVITLNAAGTAGVNLTIASVVNQGASTSLLIRGTSLGTASGSGVAAVSFDTAGAAGTFPGLALQGGGGADGSTTKSIRPDILVDTSATGNGSSFLTVQLTGATAGFVRPLAVGEYNTTFTTATAAGTNTNLSTVAFGSSTANALAAGQFAGNVTGGSLTLQSGGGINLAIVATNPWGANGGLLSDSPNVPAVLNLAGSNTITAGQFAIGNTTADFHVIAGSTLTLNAAITSGTAGFVKADGGTLVLNQTFYSNNGTTITINGGTLQLNAGANTLWVYTNGGGTPSAENLAVNTGTLDLNGNNQLIGTLTTTNPLPFAGGTAASPNSVITNSSATAATFFTNGTNNVVSTVFSGNLNLDKAGNNTLTLSSPQTYTGTTAIRGSVLVLRDSATLASTTVNVNFAELTLDNTGLSNLTNRLSSSSTLNLAGGALRVNESTKVDTTNLGTVALGSGSNLLYLNQYNNTNQTSSPTVNIANLTQSNAATLNYEVNYGVAPGSLASANSHVFLTQLNGVAFTAASMVNGIIAPWFVVNNTGNVFNWATYSNTVGVTIPNANGTANYAGALSNASLATDNSLTKGIAQIGITARTINSLAVLNAAQAVTIGLNGPLDQLVIASGGILVNDQSNKGVTTIQGGSLTAGILNAASTLYVHSYSNNGITINSPIVNNGSGALTLAHDGNAAMTLTPQVVETVTLGTTAGNTLTVPNSAGLLVGMVVSANNVSATANASSLPANTVITAISGTTNATITLNQNFTAGTASSVQQLSFAPVATTASASVTAGTNTVTIVANNSVATTTNGTTAATVAPGSAIAVGESVSGTGITAGTTVTAYNPVTGAVTLSATAVSGTGVSLAYTALPTNFAPLAGESIGTATTLAGGSTISSVSLAGVVGTNGVYTLTLNNNATTTGTSALSFGAISNTYTGGTVISASVDQYTGGTTNLSGLPGSITIPGNLTINGGATVTEVTNQGQIAATSNVTINGSGTLTLVGTNTLASVTFANSGGNATPTVNVGTTLNLSSAGTGSSSAINVQNDNTGFTPTITGGTVNFSGTSATINVTGLSPNGFSLASAIASVGTITKTGSGSLILPNANLATLNWALNGGSILVGNAISLGASGGTLTFSGTVAVAPTGASVIGIALPTSFSATGANVSLGAAFAGSGITLSGTMNLNGMAPTLNTPYLVSTNTISGQITGTGGFTKAGPGMLVLTPGTASTFTGPVNVSAGLLTLGNINGLNAAAAGTNIGADFTVGTTGELNLNAFSQSFGSLAGGGIVTNSSATAAALTVGSGSNATNANFSGSLVAATAASLSLVKTGTNNQTLSGQSYYTGVTTVAGGTLTLVNVNGATTPTLNNTAITVSVGATLAINNGSTSAVSVGVPATGTASVTLSSSNAAAATLSLADGHIGTFTINQAAASVGLAIGSSTAGQTTPANLNFDLTGGSTGNVDVIATTGKATVGTVSGGTVNVSLVSGTTSLTPGTYAIITGAAASNLNSANLTLANSSKLEAVGNTVYSLSVAPGTSTATSANLVIGTNNATATQFYWTGNVNSVWTGTTGTGSTLATNWSTSPTGAPDAQQFPLSTSDVYFTANAATNLTNTLGTDFTVNSLNFTGTGTSNTAGTSIGGSTLTLAAAGTVNSVAGVGITVAAGSGADTISSNVVLGNSQTWTNNSGNTLTVNGTTISGTNVNLTLTGSGNTTISAAIQTGSGSLIASGSGIATLFGSNTYTGPTNVNGTGTLLVHGNQTAATGPVGVAVGASLGGTGTIGGATTVAGTLFMGTDQTTAAGIGTLTVNNAVSFSTGSIWNWKIASGANLATPAGLSTGGNSGTLGVAQDVLAVTGGTNTVSTLAAGGGFTFRVAETSGSINLSAPGTYSFTVATTQSTPNLLTGTPTFDFNNAADFAAYQSTATLTGDSNHVYLNIVSPEPSTVLGLAAAGLGLGRLVRRKLRKGSATLAA